MFISHPLTLDDHHDQPNLIIFHTFGRIQTNVCCRLKLARARPLFTRHMCRSRSSASSTRGTSQSVLMRFHAAPLSSFIHSGSGHSEMEARSSSTGSNLICRVTYENCVERLETPDCPHGQLKYLWKTKNAGSPLWGVRLGRRAAPRRAHKWSNVAIVRAKAKAPRRPPRERKHLRRRRRRRRRRPSIFH